MINLEHVEGNSFGIVETESNMESSIQISFMSNLPSQRAAPPPNKTPGPTCDQALDPMGYVQITHEAGTQTDAVCIFPEDYEEPEPIPPCVCSSCCLLKRKEDPLYVPEMDSWLGLCTCNVPK